MVGAIPVCAAGISGQIYWIKIDWDEFRRCQTIHEENSRKAKEELEAQDNPCKRGWVMIGEPPQPQDEGYAVEAFSFGEVEGTYNTERRPYEGLKYHYLKALPVIY